MGCAACDDIVIEASHSGWIQKYRHAADKVVKKVQLKRAEIKKILKQKRDAGTI
jgi:5'(3')-deoxyribonucleotidase